MRFIPTRIHGILDYLMGALLIAAPWILNFNQGGAETWVPVILGAGVIVYSLMTDYELGAMKKLSMRTHLMLDFVGGAFLAVSPWLLGFSDIVFLPHLILGIAEMGASLFTKQVPDIERQDSTFGTNRSRSFTDPQVRSGVNSRVSADRSPLGSTTETRTRVENDRVKSDRDYLE